MPKAKQRTLQGYQRLPGKLRRVILAGLLFCLTLSQPFQSNSLEDSSAKAAVNSGAAPEPFLYLPFNTPEGWRYPTAWFDHHFPVYRLKTHANSPEEAACVEGKLLYHLGETIALGAGLEYPFIHPSLGKMNDIIGPSMHGFWCAECEQGRGSYIYYDGHPGYDWGSRAGVKPGTPVLAAGAGRIIEARCHNRGSPDNPDPRGPEGCSIVIKHDPPHEAYTTHYMHLYYPFIPEEQVRWPGQYGVPAVGQRVKPGQVIGRVGATGWSYTGENLEVDLHIHFEVRKHNTPVDPWGWTPYIRDPGDPDSDPLQCFNGQKSYNLFVGYEPHCYGCTLPLVPVQTYKSFTLPSSPVRQAELMGRVFFLDHVSRTDSAVFVADESIPDGMLVSPHQGLTKSWRLKNTGKNAWASGYLLVFVSGKPMGAPGILKLPPVEAGKEVSLSVPFQAPFMPGLHKSSWRLRNSKGEYFGPILWVSVEVEKR